MSRRWPRLIAIIAAFILLALLLAGACAAQGTSPSDAVTPAAVTSATPDMPPPRLDCAAAILIDPETRQVLYEHNADARRPVASLAKMMTALLVAEDGNLDRTVTVSANAAAVGETSMHLVPGEQVKLRDLLMGTLMLSANDAATACAEAVGGSLGAFVDLMNRRAAELGMSNTNFLNPHGLHQEGHVSSARDMATLAVQVMGRAELRPIVRTQQATVPWPGHEGDRVLVNRNQLLERWDACDGIKTGYTKQAGRCLAASAFVDGWRLICVVLGAKDSWTDAQMLLQWGFDSYYKVALVSADVDSATIEVRGGAVDTVQARPAEDVIAVLPRVCRPQAPALLDHVTEAPVHAGEVVGRLAVIMPDDSTRTVDLLALEDVPQSPWAMILRERWTLGALAAVLALAVGVLAHGAVAEAVGARRRR